MFGFLAEFPEQSHKIKPFIALAPVDCPPYLKFISERPSLDELLYDREFFESPGVYWPTWYLVLFVYFAASFENSAWCRDIIHFILGQKYEQIDRPRLGVYGCHFPNRTSKQNYVHIVQNLRDKRFAKFNWGEEKNMQLYGSADPPKYRLEKIDNPYIALMYSSDDPLGTPSDIENLKKQLTGKCKY